MVSARIKPFRLLVWPTLAMLVALAILMSLGTWQLQRLAWKNDLVRRITERTRLAPIPLPSESTWAGLDLEALDYRPVSLGGRFRHDAEVHVYTALTQPKGRFGGQGYRVLTPLVLADGGVVIVDRGFVPTERKDPATRRDGQVEGEVTITGLLRRPERANAFTPADDAARNIWFTRDAHAVAATAGLPVARTLPLVVDVDAASTPPGGLPQGGETALVFPNNHLQYAVTWYGLGLTLVGVYLAFARARLRTARKD